MDEIRRFRNKNTISVKSKATSSYKSKFNEYRKNVMALTEQVKHLIPGIEKRAFNGYHIDHVISIWKGFKLGISEDKIADIANLRMLPYKLNMKKGTKIND